MSEEYIEKLNSLIAKTPKVSIIYASPKSFIQYLELMTDEQLESILELYDFTYLNNNTKKDPFFIANYTYIKNLMKNKMIFDPIRVGNDTILFCKN